MMRLAKSVSHTFEKNSTWTFSEKEPQAALWIGTDRGGWPKTAKQIRRRLWQSYDPLDSALEEIIVLFCIP
jgi:hypothetical protein